MCFLHAYSVVGFRDGNGRGHPMTPLASKTSPARRGFMPPIPSLRAPPCHTPTAGACGRRLVPTTVAGIKLTYCASVMQQERSYFRQLNLAHRFSRLLMREPACLQIHYPCCQNQSAPGDNSEFGIMNYENRMNLYIKKALVMRASSVWRSGRDSNSRPNA